MMLRRPVTFSILTAALTCSFAVLCQHALSQTAARQATQKGEGTVHSKPFAKPANEDEGNRIFAQNCSRCHAAPEGFSPHISGTIVKHMRTRANLSKHDEEELMRFFNP